MTGELTIKIDGIKHKFVPDDCGRCTQCSLRKQCAELPGTKLYCNIGGEMTYGKYGHFEKVKNKVMETVIDFSARDSELVEATYFIPKGCYVEIDGDKIIIKKRNV